MPRKYVKKKNRNPVSDEKVQTAIHKIQANNLSIRKAAKTIGVDEKTLRNRIKTLNNNSELKKVGGQQALPDKVEEELAHLLSIKAKWGWASSTEEVRDLVGEYVNANLEAEGEVGDHLRRFCKFKVPN